MDTKYVNTFIQSSQCKERLNMKRKHLFLQLSFRLKFIVINAPRSTCGCKFGEENFTFFNFRLEYLVREIPSIIHSHTSHTNKNFPKVYLCYIIMQKKLYYVHCCKSIKFFALQMCTTYCKLCHEQCSGLPLTPRSASLFRERRLIFFPFFLCSMHAFLGHSSSLHRQK